MNSQLTILLATMKANWFKLLAVISTFLMPISGLLFLVGFVILLDTITGVWKSIKHKLQFFSVELMLTKVLSLILVSIEVMSINENYKAVKGLDLWQAMKNLFARAKDIKKEVDEIRHEQDITGTPI